MDPYFVFGSRPSPKSMIELGMPCPPDTQTKLFLIEDRQIDQIPTSVLLVY